MKKIISIIIIIVCFITTSVIGPLPASAQQSLLLSTPGTMVKLTDAFLPPMLTGIKVYPEDPFKLDFILSQGDNVLSTDDVKSDANRLIKYFLAAVTVPEKDLWVNLSPNEPDRIVPEAFGQTEMGRDLLAQDYLLKQITATLTSPESELGKTFWSKVNAQANSFNPEDLKSDFFNKVWIVPQKAVVYENAKLGTAYVIESRLKVMVEEDYVSHKDTRSQDTRIDCDIVTCDGVTGHFATNVFREVILPVLENEINNGQNFIKLRQVYNSLILAAWYKQKIKNSILHQLYNDQNKIQGVNIDDPDEKEKIYEQYLEAFKRGVYDTIKEEYDPVTQSVINHQYFSGGMNLNFAMMATNIQTDKALLILDGEVDLPPAAQPQNPLIIQSKVVAFDPATTDNANHAMTAIDLEKTAVVFPPVGNAFEGMGRDLYEKYDYVKAIYEEANQAARDYLNDPHFDLREISFDGKEDDFYPLKNTVIAQVALVTYEIALWEVYKREYLKGRSPKMLYGVSRGSVVALYASGALTLRNTIEFTIANINYFIDASRLADNRRMGFVMGLDLQGITELMNEHPELKATMSVRYSKNRFIISLPQGNFGRLQEILKDKGGAFVASRIPASTHDPYLADQPVPVKAYTDFLRTLPINVPSVTVYSSLTPGKVLKTDQDIRDELWTSQVQSLNQDEIVPAFRQEDIKWYVWLGGKDAFIKHHKQQGLIPKDSQSISVLGASEIDELVKSENTNLATVVKPSNQPLNNLWKWSERINVASGENRNMEIRNFATTISPEILKVLIDLQDLYRQLDSLANTKLSQNQGDAIRTLHQAMEEATRSANENIVQALRDFIGRNLPLMEKVRVFQPSVNAVQHPLYIIQTHPDQLQDPRVQELVKQISIKRRQLWRLVEHFMKMSDPKDPKPFGIFELNNNVNDLIRESLQQEIARSRYHLRFRFINFDTTFDPEIPNVVVDRKRFITALKEIIVNAAFSTIKVEGRNEFASYRGKSVVKIETKRLSDEEILISIKDNGVGMTPEEIEQMKLFAFHKDKDAGTGHIEFGGYGVGFPLSLRTIEEHGGTINVISSPEWGTDVQIRLPVKSFQAESNPAQLSAEPSDLAMLITKKERLAILSEFWDKKTNDVEISLVLGAAIKKGQFNTLFRFEGSNGYQPGQIAIGIGPLEEGDELWMRRESKDNEVIFERRRNGEVITSVVWVKSENGKWENKGDPLLWKFWTGEVNEVNITLILGTAIERGVFNEGFRFDGNGYHPGEIAIGIGYVEEGGQVWIRRHGNNINEVVFEHKQNGSVVSSAIWGKHNNQWSIKSRMKSEASPTNKARWSYLGIRNRVELRKERLLFVDKKGSIPTDSENSYIEIRNRLLGNKSPDEQARLLSKWERLLTSQEYQLLSLEIFNPNIRDYEIADDLEVSVTELEAIRNTAWNKINAHLQTNPARLSKVESNSAMISGIQDIHVDGDDAMLDQVTTQLPTDLFDYQHNIERLRQRNQPLPLDQQDIKLHPENFPRDISFTVNQGGRQVTFEGGWSHFVNDDKDKEYFDFVLFQKGRKVDEPGDDIVLRFLYHVPKNTSKTIYLEMVGVDFSYIPIHGICKVMTRLLTKDVPLIAMVVLNPETRQVSRQFNKETGLDSDSLAHSQLAITLIGRLQRDDFLLGIWDDDGPKVANEKMGGLVPINFSFFEPFTQQLKDLFFQSKEIEMAYYARPAQINVSPDQQAGLKQRYPKEKIEDLKKRFEQILPQIQNVEFSHKHQLVTLVKRQIERLRVLADDASLSDPPNEPNSAMIAVFSELSPEKRQELLGKMQQVAQAFKERFEKIASTDEWKKLIAWVKTNKNNIKSWDNVTKQTKAQELLDIVTPVVKLSSKEINFNDFRSDERLAEMFGISIGTKERPNVDLMYDLDDKWNKMLQLFLSAYVFLDSPEEEDKDTVETFLQNALDNLEVWQRLLDDILNPSQIKWEVVNQYSEKKSQPEMTYQNFLKYFAQLEKSDFFDGIDENYFLSLVNLGKVTEPFQEHPDDEPYIRTYHNVFKVRDNRNREMFFKRNSSKTFSSIRLELISYELAAMVGVNTPAITQVPGKLAVRILPDTPYDPLSKLPAAALIQDAEQMKDGDFRSQGSGLEEAIVFSYFVQFADFLLGERNSHFVRNKYILRDFGNFNKIERHLGLSEGYLEPTNVLKGWASKITEVDPKHLNEVISKVEQLDPEDFYERALKLGYSADKAHVENLFKIRQKALRGIIRQSLELGMQDQKELDLEANRKHAQTIIEAISTTNSDQGEDGSKPTEAPNPAMIEGQSMDDALLSREKQRELNGMLMLLADPDWVNRRSATFAFLNKTRTKASFPDKVQALIGNIINPVGIKKGKEGNVTRKDARIASVFALGFLISVYEKNKPQFEDAYKAVKDGVTNQLSQDYQSLGNPQRLLEEERALVQDELLGYEENLTLLENLRLIMMTEPMGQPYQLREWVYAAIRSLYPDQGPQDKISKIIYGDQGRYDSITVNPAMAVGRAATRDSAMVDDVSSDDAIKAEDQQELASNDEMPHSPILDPDDVTVYVRKGQRLISKVFQIPLGDVQYIGDGGSKIAYLVNGVVIRYYFDKKEVVTEAEMVKAVNNDKLTARIIDVPGLPLDIVERVIPKDKVKFMESIPGRDWNKILFQSIYGPGKTGQLTFKKVVESANILATALQQAATANPLFPYFESDDNNVGLVVRQEGDGSQKVYLVGLDLGGDEWVPSKIEKLMDTNGQLQEPLATVVQEAAPYGMDYKMVAKADLRITALLNDQQWNEVSQDLLNRAEQYKRNQTPDDVSAKPVVEEETVGGIDFNTEKMDLEIQNTDGEIQFTIDPAQLEQLKNAPGFMPIIINIQPMTVPLSIFLGLKDKTPEDGEEPRQEVAAIKEF